MNLMYISPMKIDMNNLDGVAKKILSQCEAFQNIVENDKVYLASYFNGNTYKILGNEFEYNIKFNKKSSKQLELMEIYPQLPQVCYKLDIKVVYFRVYALSWATHSMFRELQKKNIKIVIEIPTYPFWKEKWIDVFTKLKKGKVGIAAKSAAANIVYFVYLHRLKNLIDQIVTFSDVKQLWGIDVVGITNGYNFHPIDVVKKINSGTNVLNLLMVASIRDNHGADRVIKGIAEYKKSGGLRKINFHIVGDGDVVPMLKQMVIDLKDIEENIIFHGFKSGEELEKIYDIADMGVSAIGFHRLGVFYASPLKSKEYFAKGLPVIGTTVEHDIMQSESKKYYLAFPEDNTSIDIKRVCEFYDDLGKLGCTNQDIVTTAAQDFSWRKIMQSVYDVLK